MLENFLESKIIEFDSAFIYNGDKFHCKSIVNYSSKTTEFVISSDSGYHKIGGILPFICTDFKLRQNYIIKCIDSHFKLMQFSNNLPLNSDNINFSI